MIKFIDAHGFAGGLSCGISLNGDFTLVGKKEGKGAFGADNMEANRHILGNDWVTQAGPYEEWEPHEAQLLATNPPCSGFSSMSNKNFRGMQSTANACMWGVTEYAARVKPEIFIMESVSQAFNQGRPLMQQLREHLEKKSGLQYELTHVLHSARSCGAPQLRQRYFLVAHRVPFGIEAPDTSRLATVHDAIGDLEDLRLQWDDQVIPHGGETRLTDVLRRRGYRNSFIVDGHQVKPTKYAESTRYLCDVVGWKGREARDIPLKRAWDNGIELPEPWAAQVEKWVERNWYMGYNQPMRLAYDSIAGATTGAALEQYIHPTLPRTLTHREVARLMGFPDTWLIAPAKESKSLPYGWGKGVTVDCGRWIGRAAKNAILGTPEKAFSEVIGEREYLVDYRSWWKTLV